MKIRACDYCKEAEGKLTETMRYFRWKHRATGMSINVDLCDAHVDLPRKLGIRTTEQAIGWVESRFKTVPPAEAAKVSLAAKA